MPGTGTMARLRVQGGLPRIAAVWLLLGGVIVAADGKTRTAAAASYPDVPSDNARAVPGPTDILLEPFEVTSSEEGESSDVGFSPVYLHALRGLGAPERSRTRPRVLPSSPPPRDPNLRRVQLPADPLEFGTPGRTGESLSTIVTDPPIRYPTTPRPSQVDDIEARDGPQIPEPMVFDLVRGLGARRGELEINVLNLVPFYRGAKYEWAPEIEFVLFDGFALEFELPIFNTTIQSTKYAAQYTFGTALDDAFIHGVQGILFHEIETGDVAPTLLYLAGLRLNRHWSLFGMFGFSIGPQVFPFADIPPRRGTDLITNLSVFYDVNERLVLGVETNLARRLQGSSDFLIMPQLHYHFNEHFTLQFGMGYRDDVIQRIPELGFRVIWER